MPKMRFTKLGVERLKPPPKGKQLDYFDTIMPGLLLRASYGGTKTWRCLYYRRGKPKTVMIGRYPTIKLDEARNKAREMLKVASEGNDPRGYRAKQADTVEAVVEEFIERYAKPKNRTWREQKRVLVHEAVSRWRDRQIESIARRDVIELLDEIIDRGAVYGANRTLAALRKMFNWAVERGIVEASPVAGIRSPGKEMSRDRVLDDREVRAMWLAWDQLGWPWQPYFRLLLLTAQRRGEIANMRWSDVDVGAKVWSLPREFVKANRAHEVPLSQPVVAILERLPRFEGPFIFSTTSGQRPVSGFSKAKSEADAFVEEMAAKGQCVELGPYRLHDLRRTAASGMARLGTPPHVLAAILNHAPASSMGITAIYNRHRYADEKRVALDAWARHVTSLSGARPDNVVPLAR